MNEALKTNSKRNERVSLGLGTSTRLVKIYIASKLVTDLAFLIVEMKEKIENEPNECDCKDLLAHLP